MMRASGPIDFAPIDCFRLLESGGKSSAGGFDELSDDTYFCSKQGVNAYEIYHRTKGMFVI